MINVLLLVIAFLVSCGYEEKGDHESPEVVYVEGPAGKDGKDGADGYGLVYLLSSAVNCVGTMVFTGVDTNRNRILDLKSDKDIKYFEVCNGQNGTNGKDGLAGKDGLNGKDGVNGKDGKDGSDGKDGTNALPVIIVDPCGDAPGIIDEILIMLPTGQVMASLSDKTNGHNTRLSILPPGSYMTTDGSSCKFKISATGDIYDEYY